MPHDKFDDSETRYVVQEGKYNNSYWTDFYKEVNSFEEGMVELAFAREEHKEGSFRLKRIDVWY